MCVYVRFKQVGPPAKSVVLRGRRMSGGRGGVLCRCVAPGGCVVVVMV